MYITKTIMFELAFERLLTKCAAMICYKMFTCDAAFTCPFYESNT